MSAICFKFEILSYITAFYGGPNMRLDMYLVEVQKSRRHRNQVIGDQPE